MKRSLVVRWSLVAATALGVGSRHRTARAEWNANGSGVRYWLPPSWATSPLEGGVIARSSNGVSVWVVPLGPGQLASASAPETLFGGVLTRPRAISRTVALSALVASGRWSQGTATFERRSVRWWARVVRLDVNHGALAVAISPRATLASGDAEFLETALNSAYLVDAPGVVRYVGMGTFTASGRVARTIETPFILELRGAGDQRTITIPDLDDNPCTFRARVQQSGALRLDSDQACPFNHLGFTMVLTGGVFEVTGPSASFTASGRMSFMGRAQRGPMIAGSVAFNWRVQATRPQ